jgi:hypothetical protein
MAMYVVVRFEDDEVANDFVSDTAWETVGMYKAPTQYCDNSDMHRKVWLQGGVVFGKKWGWLVCKHCGKPLAYTKDSHRMFMAKNLLEEMEKL